MVFGEVLVAVIPNFLEVGGIKQKDDMLAFGDRSVFDRVSIIAEEDFLISRVHFFKKAEF